MATMSTTYNSPLCGNHEKSLQGFVTLIFVANGNDKGDFFCPQWQRIGIDIMFLPLRGPMTISRVKNSKVKYCGIYTMNVDIAGNLPWNEDLPWDDCNFCSVT